MSENQTQEAVLKINTALSNKPIYVKISDPNMSMDRIIGEAISTLQNSGKPLESEQLSSLYQNHQMFNNGQVIQKGSLFSELSSKTQQIGTQDISVTEIDLVTSHSGGM